MALPENGGSARPDKSSVFSTPLLIAAAPVIDRFQQGKVALPTARKELRMALQPKYDDLLRAEKAAVAIQDALSGMESLTTNTSGAHDINWFSETGLIFASGVPSTGLVVAFVHPEVGMSVSHQNLVTVEDLIEFALRTAKSTFAQNMVESSPDASVARMMVPETTLIRTVQNATTHALTAFASLSPSGVPIDGTEFYMLGGDFLTESQSSMLFQRARDSLQAHKAMHDGRAKNIPGGRKISAQNNLGSPERHGVLWGGPHHPQYSKPALYTT